MPIGVFDSGLGGLTVLAAVRERLPGQGFVYFGDNANAPYGARDAETIFRLTLSGVERLYAAGCNLVVLACNTAAAVALRRIQAGSVPPDRRVLGVLVPVIEAVAGRSWGDRRAPTPAATRRCLFFATPATVTSGAFSRELRLRATGVEIVEVACPGLVDALERADRPAADRLIEEAAAAGLSAMPSPEAAVLGCTHYPLAQASFAAALPPGVSILSQPRLVAESLADYLRRHPEFAGPGGVSFLTSGEPAAVAQAARALLGRAPPFRRV